MPLSASSAHGSLCSLALLEFVDTDDSWQTTEMLCLLMDRSSHRSGSVPHALFVWARENQ